MTIPTERTRALVWAGGFLIELAQDESLPLSVRRQAVAIARHFPTIEDVRGLAHQSLSSGHPRLVDPAAHSSWSEECKFGPLQYSTRLHWPEDEEE
jgi:hypothetical protein